MGRHYSQEGTPIKRAITIGNFDGVHAGHRWLLKKLIQVASVYNLEPMVLSFFGHPKVFKEAPPIKYLLTTPDERRVLIKSLGINHVEFLKLDKKIMSMTPQEFIRDVLKKRFNMSLLFMGFNHHFGKNREGTPEKVAGLVKELEFTLVVLPPFKIDGTIISSTIIRNLLKEGKTEEALLYLGRPYTVCGRVIKGKEMAGKLLGVRTANVELSPLKLIPKDGIYAVWVHVEGEKFMGALYIGDNPTLKNEFSFEVHILNFAREIYGKTICLEFVKRIRDTKKFDDIAELKKNILSDIQKVKEILIKKGHF